MEASLRLVLNQLANLAVFEFEDGFLCYIFEFLQQQEIGRPRHKLANGQTNKSLFRRIPSILLFNVDQDANLLQHNVQIHKKLNVLVLFQAIVMQPFAVIESSHYMLLYF